MACKWYDIHMRTCKVCGATRSRWTSKYCSNKCQAQHQYAEFIASWQDGNAKGSRGISTKNISKHLKKFLLEKYGGKCSVCSWSKRHPVTGVVPLEVDHVDGDADNNLEVNLRLLCPNCHSLTPNFRNLNKGKGRSHKILPA